MQCIFLNFILLLSTPSNACVIMMTFRLVLRIACEQHVTNNRHAYRIFPLRKTVVSTSELSFSVRAVISASVTYYTAPAKQTPHLVVSISEFVVTILVITVFKNLHGCINNISWNNNLKNQ